LGRLEAARATALRTDLRGLVTLYTDGRKLEVGPSLLHAF
jgi:beta-lactamase superfamily II metal-dependent hydrolase